MILEFKVENFLSIKDEQVLSFEATSDKHLSEYHVVEIKPGVKILKMAMIYGANASGKTNILKAFDFLRDFAVNPREKGQNTGFVPFKPFISENNEIKNIINSNSRFGRFEIIFFVNQKKYKYILKIDSLKVIYEKLYFYPKTQPAELFSRDFNDNIKGYNLKFGSKIKPKKINEEILKTFTLENSSLISTMSKFDIMFEIKERNDNNIKFSSLKENKQNYVEISNVFDFFKDTNICFKKISLLSKSIFKDVIEDPIYYKEYILPKLKKADFNIIDYEIINEKIGVENIYKIKFKHKVSNKKFFYLYDFEESVGTNLYFGLIAWLGRLNGVNNIWAIDELESSLHPELVNHFINTFLYEVKNTNSQLIFTTHNINLLDEEFVRKDIVWFTNKKEDGSTELYSLADFNIRKELSFSKAYKNGAFGATPIIDSVY